MAKNRTPKRKLRKTGPKGSKLMSAYIKYKTLSQTDWSQTCTNTGCTVDSGMPRTDIDNIYMRRVTINTDASTVRGSLPWKGRNYYTGKGWGGPYSRRLNGSYIKYGPQGQILGTVYYDRGTLNFPGTYANSVVPSEPASLRTEAKAIALAKLSSSLVDARTQWNLAVTLGEARETAAMIAHTAARVGKAFLSFKKGRITDSWRQLRGKDRVPVHHQENFRELKRRSNRDTWVDEVASAWMEYSYGWRPLLGDIDSAAKYLAEKHVRGYYPVQEVSRAHRVRATKYTKEGSNPIFGIREWTSSHSRFTYELYPDWARRPSTLNELGFTDPYSLAWELLPLSFVTDWFVNVGQVLQSLHEFSQWKVKRGISSYRSNFLAERDLVKNWSGSPPSAVEIYPTMYRRFSWLDRRIETSLPTAVPLRIKVDNPFDLSMGQMASAASLLRFAFR